MKRELKNITSDKAPKPRPETKITPVKKIAAKKSSSETHQQIQKRFRALVEHNEGIISLLDENLNVIFRSASGARITGWAHDEYEKISPLQYLHPDDIQKAKQAMAEALASPGKAIPVATRVRHKKGHYIWLEGVIRNMLHDADIRALVINMQDVTKRMEAEQKLIRVNRLYLFISQVNQMIVRAKDEASLFKEACEIAVNLGKFRMAWIGLIDEKTKTVVPVMHAGEEMKYLSRIKTISVDAIPAGNGPTGTALREGKYIICNDIENDPQMAPWKEAATGRGYHSSMALPIKKFGKITGAFSFYSSEKNYFDSSEIALLEEATGDVSYALENFERETLRKKAEEGILREKYLSDSIINSLPGIFYLYDKKGKFLRWNRNFEDVSGYSAEEIRNMHPLDFFADDEKDLLAHKIGNVFINGEDNVLANILKKSKERIPYYFTGRLLQYQEEPCLMGVGIDFSERVKAQEEIRQASEKLHQLTAYLQNVREEERKRIGREIHDELGQQITAIKMDVAWVYKKMDTEETDLKVKLKNVIALLDGSNRSIRRILSELRPDILDTHGLKDVIRWLGNQFTEKTYIPVTFNSNIDGTQIPEPTTNCIFRICQEAFTNILQGMPTHTRC